jgi:predicted O-methyltransferase YrrM
MTPITTLDHRDNFGHWLARNHYRGSGVEVGVAYGENARNILSAYTGWLYLVDPYDVRRCAHYDDPTARVNFPRALDHARRLLSFHRNHTFILDTSDVASALFPAHSLDFAYIDGNHAAPQFQADLANWLPKIRPGGILCGHDYLPRETTPWPCDVIEYVDHLASRLNLQLHLTPCASWWLQLPL